MTKLKTISVNETTPLQLDWLVAKCEGYNCQFDDEISGPWLVPQEGYLHDEKPLSKFNPTTAWNIGGPIIEREKISLECKQDGWWVASIQYNYSDEKEYLILGHSPLVTAMCCYVASKLGDKVQIPEELG